MDAHPYRTFIEQQAKRAEDDLAAFRSRSLTVISTSAGVVALITGLTAFSATKAKNEGGLPIAGVVFVGLALVCFLIASTLALLAQQSGKVETPDNDDMIELADRDRWYGTNDAGTPDTPDQERVTAKMTAKYAVSVHNVAQQAADYMDARSRPRSSPFCSRRSQPSSSSCTNSNEEPFDLLDTVRQLGLSLISRSEDRSRSRSTSSEPAHP